MACLTDVTSDTYKQLRINECIAVAFGMTDTVNSTCPTLVDTYCTKNPFADNVHCTDGTTYNAPRITRANKCYELINRDTKECNNVKSCLVTANLFSESAQFGGIACNNTALNGARARYCSEGDNIVTEKAVRCAAKPTSNPCIVNPFDPSCEGVMGTAGVAKAQENRVNHCFRDGNGGGVQCIFVHSPYPCIRNPFGAACKIDEEACMNDPSAVACRIDYDFQRQARVDYCSGDPDSPSFSPATCESAKPVICKEADMSNDGMSNGDMRNFADVFAPFCLTGARVDAHVEARKKVAELCAGDTMPKPKTCDRITTCTDDPYDSDPLCSDAGLVELKPLRVEACKSVTDPGVICAEQALVEVCNTTPFAWHCHPSNIPDYI
ncbi:MAG: hypothetical protein K8953_09970, partial [Proteobacteria bacterium]|nr:hypothetical protein [Pseudomonadota bacterium]